MSTYLRPPPKLTPAPSYPRTPNTNDDGDEVVEASITDGESIDVRPHSSLRSAFGMMKVAQEYTLLHLSFPCNVNTDLIAKTEANSATLTHGSTNMLTWTTGTNTAGSVIGYSKDLVKYVPGQGICAQWTCSFSPGKASSRQYFGIGSATDGFFYGYNGTSFGILHRNASVDTWIPQASWNEWTFPDLNPNYLVPMQVQFQWLGGGYIVFSLEDPDTGLLRPVHCIRRPNTSASTSLANPTLGMYGQAINEGNNTSLVMKTPSFKISTEAPPNEYGLLGAWTNRKAAVGTTPTNILTIQNKSTYASVTNRVRVRLVGLSFSGSVDSAISLVLNTTLGGAPSYTDFSTNTSPISYDTAGTTLTGGRQVASFVAEANTSPFIDLIPFSLYMNPGDKLTCAGNAGTGTSTIQVALNWREEF